MTGAAKFGRICRTCGSKNNHVDAKRCEACGTDLDASEETTAARFVDDDPALRHVDLNNRIELGRFDRLEQAELACGLLRTNGIACELGSMVIPGLPTDLILWVHTGDAELAWALLADVEREASKRDPDAA